MSVLAVLFASLAMATSVSADQPTDPPGNSGNAPGHQDDQQLPPGQDDVTTPPGHDGTTGGDDTSPGNSGEHKITICHFVSGKGETKDGYNVITVSQNSWDKHHSQHGDVVYNGVSCPTVPEPVTASLAICTAARTVVTVTAQGASTTEAQANLATALLAYPGYTTAPCPTNPPTNPPGDNPGGTTLTGEVAATAPVEVAPVEAATAGTALPGKTPAKAAPQAARVPAAIPAGLGGTADEHVIPLWAMALAGMAALTAAGSATRLVATKR